MRWKNTPAGYGSVSVTLHWLMLVLFAIAYVTMEFKSVFPKGSAGRNAMADVHYLSGLAVFALVWLRFIAQHFGTEPLVAPPIPRWQLKLAHLVHYALYVLMVALPLAGWLTLSARGTHVSFAGVDLPLLIARQSRQTAKLFEEIHEFLGNVGYFLIGIHAAAALFHHYFKRDNTLRLMWYR